MPHVLVPWTWGALSDMLQSCFRKLPSCFQAIELLLYDHLSVLESPQYNCEEWLPGRILYACNKWSLLGPPKDPLQQNGKELFFKLQFVNCISQVNSYSFVTQDRHYFYAGIHCVGFLSSNQSKGRIAASLGMDICMVRYKSQISLIHSANPTSYHLCMVN